MAKTHVEDFYFGVPEHFVGNYVVENPFKSALGQIFQGIRLLWPRSWLLGGLCCLRPLFWMSTIIWNISQSLHWAIIVEIASRFSSHLYIDFSIALVSPGSTRSGSIFLQHRIPELIDSHLVHMFAVPHKVCRFYDRVSVVFFPLHHTFTISEPFCLTPQLPLMLSLLIILLRVFLDLVLQNFLARLVIFWWFVVDSGLVVVLD